MSSAVPLVIALLKAAAPVGAIVADRIEPEIAKGTTLPRIVVRQLSGRQVYGLARSTGVRDARVTVLCAASTYTASDALAEAVIAALKDIRGAAIGSQRVTLFQEGEDTGTLDEQGRTHTRYIGFRASISG